MPDRRPIADWHAWSETHRRPTCLIGDPSQTDMPDQRPKGDCLAWLETNMPNRIPTCLIVYQHAWAKTHWRPTCLIGDPQSIRNIYLTSDRLRVKNVHIRYLNTPFKRMIGLPCIWYLLWCSDQECWSPIRHVGLRSGMLVSDQACQSPMCV